MHRLVVLLPAGIILVGWQLLVRHNPTAFFLAGSPSEIGEILLAKTLDVHAWYDVWLSGSAAAVGLCFGVLLGTFVGLSLALLPRVERIAQPYLLVLGTIPILALAPLLILWLGIGWWSKVWIAVIGTFVISLQLSHAGALATAAEYSTWLAALNPGRFAVLRHLLLPGALRWVVTGARSSIGVAILGVFIGECLNSQAGLGHMIMRASSLYRVSEVWCGILFLAALAWSFDRVIVRLAGRYISR